jgi:hypothetical protein
MTAQQEFSTVLLESMDGAIKSLLSEEVFQSFLSNLKEKRSISPDDIPNELPTVSIVLKKYFGPSAGTIERAIIQRLCSKYGFEFQRNDDLQLEGYIRNIRTKLSPAPPLESTNVNLPLRDDFDRLFLESVKETIEEALGKDRAKLAFHFLEQEVPFDKLPRHLPTFYSALRNNFGKNSGRVETAIARKLYQKLSLEFTETPNTELGRYVETALVKLSQREQLGFVNISSTI